MLQRRASGSDPGDARRKGAGAEFSANFFDLYLPIFIPHVFRTQLSAGAATALIWGRGGALPHSRPLFRDLISLDRQLAGLRVRKGFYSVD